VNFVFDTSLSLVMFLSAMYCKTMKVQPKQEGRNEASLIEKEQIQ